MATVPPLAFHSTKRLLQTRLYQQHIAKKKCIATTYQCTKIQLFTSAKEGGLCHRYHGQSQSSWRGPGTSVNILKKMKSSLGGGGVGSLMQCKISKHNSLTSLPATMHASHRLHAQGKWHLGQRPMFLPGARGFDTYLGIPYSDDMGQVRVSAVTPHP